MALDPIKDSLVSHDTSGPNALTRFGIYDAIVEYNADPLQLGRVVVRVPLVHKPEYGVTMLPWARPCSPFGGGPGYGSYMIPPVGSRVWVMFESGDELYPVWLGTWVSNPVVERKMLRDTLNEYPKKPSAMAPNPTKPWTSPAAPGLPKEAQGQMGNRPEIYVPFKSPKGAALVIDDRDGKEQLAIYDRLGQVILFDGPISIGGNYNNQSRRSNQKAQDGDTVPLDRGQSKEGRILIADVGGQSIELKSTLDASTFETREWAGKIRISSRQPIIPEQEAGAAPTRTEIKGGPPETEGKNAVVVELSGADNKLTIDLSVEGSITTSVHIDAASGNITIDTPNSILLKSSQIKLDGDVSITGTLKASNAHINNNLIVSGQLIS
jgi:hypothetical protein